jgi:hypothetical protein
MGIKQSSRRRVRVLVDCGGMAGWSCKWYGSKYRKMEGGIGESEEVGW